MANRIRKPRLWAMEQARAWRAEYDADTSLTATTLAARTGLSRCTIENALLSAGGTLRPSHQSGLRLRRTPAKKPRRQPDWHRQALHLRDRYESDLLLSVQVLSEQTGLSFGKVHKLLASVDTRMRGRGGNHRQSPLPVPEPAATADAEHVSIYRSLFARRRAVVREMASGKTIEGVAGELRTPTVRVVNHTDAIAAAFKVNGYDEVVAIARSLFPPGEVG